MIQIFACLICISASCFLITISENLPLSLISFCSVCLFLVPVIGKGWFRDWLFSKMLSNCSAMWVKRQKIRIYIYIYIYIYDVYSCVELSLSWMDPDPNKIISHAHSAFKCASVKIFYRDIVHSATFGLWL